MIRYFRKKLSRKLVALCILMALILCAATVVSGYFVTRDSYYRIYDDFAYQIGEIARSYVDGDRILTYLETGEPDEAYDDMAQNIYRIYSNTDLHEYNSGIYICVPDRERLVLTNIFDVRVIDAPEDKKALFAIGKEDPIGVENVDNSLAVYEQGIRPEDYFIHKTGFGYNSSAILPIYNSENEIVAQLVADMPMPLISSMLRRYVISAVIVSLVMESLVIWGFVLVIRRSIVTPLTVISQEAEDFTGKDIRISEKLPKIRQIDEIGTLAGSVLRMEKDINEYVKNITAVTAEKERIGAELDIATNIQASMLPRNFPTEEDHPEFSIYATMDPAKEVGGDFYDFFMLDERHLAIVVADVSGKGVPAALFMVIGKTLIRDHTGPATELSDVFRTVNDLLCEANSEGLFITAFEGVLDLVTGEFTYVNAGHEIPFISRGDEGFRPYKIRAGFVLAGMENMKFRGGSLMLEPGDKIFQYTDGVTEATDSDEQLYGMERLEAVLNGHSRDDVRGILQAVKTDMDNFVGEAPQFDDITMLCLEYRKRLELPEKNTENTEDPEKAKENSGLSVA